MDKTHEKILVEAKDRFKKSSDAEQDNRTEALDDLRFARLGEQWPNDVVRAREREGRPCLTINRLPTFIRQVTNDARLNKPAIKVHPVDDHSDPETAEIINGLIRNIEVSSNADAAYIQALESSVTSGLGYFRISMDYACDDVFDMDLKIDRISNPFTVYADPDGIEVDSSDWMYAFVTEWMPKEKFEHKYKDALVADWDADSTGDTEWVTEDSVRIAEYWKREEITRDIVQLSDGSTWDIDEYSERKEIFDMSGLTIARERKAMSYKVTQYILCGGQVLETNPWPGKYIPIVPVYGDEINVDGKRHLVSLIRFAKDPQRMFNYWRTASTELVALAPKAPFIGPAGAFDTDADKWATANTKSHPYIEYDGGIAPQRQPFSGVPAGALQESLNASDDMKSIIGMYDASLGARSNETSGKAIMARQREGDISTFHFIDNLSKAIRHAGRILIDLIPKVYDKPRVVRILGPEDDSENVKINQQTEDMDKIYDLTVGRYDVTVSSGPSFTTRREEAVAQMTDMIRAYPDVAPLIGDILAKNLDWPGADEIAKRLKAMLPPQIKQMEDEGKSEIPPEAQAMMQSMQQNLQQMQQQMQQGMQEFQKVQAENQGLKTQISSKSVDKEIKDVEAQVKMEELQVKREELAIRRGEAMLQGAVIEGNPIIDMMAQISAGIEQMGAMQAMLAQEMARPKQKSMQITAPSGQVYEGQVVEQ
jgi:hypothetical protein